MAKNTIDYFGNLMKEVKKKEEKQEVKVIEVEKNIITLDENLEKYTNIKEIDNITEDKEVRQYLKDKFKKYLQLGANQNILLGQYYTELFNELSSKVGANQFTSTYTKYIVNILKISVKTAKRYRDRYELFELSTNPTLKSLISILSHEDIRVLYQNKDEYLPKLNECKTFEEIENLMMGNKLQSSPQKSIDFLINYDIQNLTDNLLNTTEKIEGLLNKKDRTLDEERKAQKVAELLYKIEEILK